MVLILNSPMRADGAGEGLGIEVDLAGITADLLAARPQTGPGVRLKGQARDPGHAGDQRRPLGVQLSGGVEPLDQSMLLAAMTPPVSWRSKGWCSAQSLASVSCKLGWFRFTWTSRPLSVSAARVKLSFWQCRASAVNSTPPTR